jgi:hypothetical protein
MPERRTPFVLSSRITGLHEPGSATPDGSFRSPERRRPNLSACTGIWEGAPSNERSRRPNAVDTCFRVALPNRNHIAAPIGEISGIEALRPIAGCQLVTGRPPGTGPLRHAGGRAFASVDGGARGGRVPDGNAGTMRRDCAGDCCRDHGRDARWQAPPALVAAPSRLQARPCAIAVADGRGRRARAPAGRDRRASSDAPHHTSGHRRDAAPLHHGVGRNARSAPWHAESGQMRTARANRSGRASGVPDGSAWDDSVSIDTGTKGEMRIKSERNPIS